MNRYDRSTKRANENDGMLEWAPPPGKRTLVGSVAQSLPMPVQARALESSAGAVQARGNLSGDVPTIAGHGVAGASASLPYLDTIQQSFGSHDVSGIRAQVGGPAAEAASSIGAQAYATGDRVAFASAPDLHTAAHEAAHVVQQRAGVHLKGGVGEAGDPYEQHADQVADLVVQGRSAQGALDAGISHRGGSSGWAVQRKLKFGPGTEYLAKGPPGISGYDATIKEAQNLKQEIAVSVAAKGARPAYSPDPNERKGTILIDAAPAKETTAGNQTPTYYNSFLSMAHETRHAIDDLNKKVNFRSASSEERIHTEWRSFATHSAVASQMKSKGLPANSRFQGHGDFASREAFMKSGSRTVDMTGAYLRAYGINPSADDKAAQDFMAAHTKWVDDAIALFKSLHGTPQRPDSNPNEKTDDDHIVDVLPDPVATPGADDEAKKKEAAEELFLGVAVGNDAGAKKATEQEAAAQAAAAHEAAGQAAAAHAAAAHDEFK